MSNLENITHDFIIYPNETNAVNLIRMLRSSNMFQTCMLLCEYFSKMFPFSTDIKDEYSISSYYSNNHEKAFDIHESSLSMKGLSESMSWRILFNQHFSINNVADRYIFYSKEKVNYILNRKPIDFPLVTLTITTCKRFDLFEKTMNSLLNCVDIDKIDFWFCVDDNSSSNDREKMQIMYPFFKFYFKDVNEKGHPQSMNIIKNNVKTPYLFHLEDDWKFFIKRNYIEDAIDIIESNKNIGQCLFNKNYAEIESDIDIKGGIYKTTNRGFRYYIHEYCKTQEETIQWKIKYGNCKSSFYWPHWSLRPSILRTSILSELGEFNEKISHFEMDYAYRYANKGYISAFFEGIYCLHTGRLTSERNDESKLNAYKLNNEIQFYGKEEEEEKKKLTFKTFVINLDRRSDRWEMFKKNSKDYERFSAVDGKEIKNSIQLQQIFENNDYHMRRGMVGCLLSHVKLYIQLINQSEYDYYMILEDDVEFTPNFEEKYNNMLNKVSDWDFIFLGHHIRDKEKQKDELNKQEQPIATKRDVYWSFLNSLGGTGGYIITRNGAEKLLDFINSTGSTNGIDTLIQKSANMLNIYYPNPHLIFTDCYRGDNTIDTDIQYDHSNDLVKSLDERLNNEIEFYKNNNFNLIFIDNFNNAINLAKNGKETFYYRDTSENKIKEIINSSSYSYYTLEDSIVFIVPNSNEIPRYYHRFKKNDKFNIDDIFLLK